jgi:hypothetical protein
MGCMAALDAEKWMQNQWFLVIKIN